MTPYRPSCAPPCPAHALSGTSKRSISHPLGDCSVDAVAHGMPGCMCGPTLNLETWRSELCKSLQQVSKLLEHTYSGSLKGSSVPVFDYQTGMDVSKESFAGVSPSDGEACYVEALERLGAYMADRIPSDLREERVVPIYDKPVRDLLVGNFTKKHGITKKVLHLTCN